MRLANPHPLFLATFINGKLVVAVQMADIESFRSLLHTCCLTAEDTGQGRLLKQGKSNFYDQLLGSASMPHGPSGH